MAEPFAAALQALSRDELRAALGSRRPALGPVLVARLSSRLRSFGGPLRPLSLAVVRSYSTELLRPYWEFEALLHGFDAKVYEAPYGIVDADPAERLRIAEHRPDLVVCFLRPEDLNPAITAPWSLVPAAERSARIAAAQERLGAIVDGWRAATPAPIVVTLLPRLGEPELGLQDAISDDSEAVFRFELKRAVAAGLRREARDAFFSDLDLVVEDIGRRRLFDPRLWYSSRFPFSAEGGHHLVRRLFAWAVLGAEPPAKCIVVDADNTLWGGIVGEDGPSGIALGPDHPGSLFVELQYRLLAFRRRGLLLAMASRNNRDDVLEVLRDHPHQVLREQDFAALEIDWGSKVDALRRIASTLGIGTDTLVFLDDSPHDCVAVRTEMPEVTVVQAPADALELPGCLDEVARLEARRLTEEDLRRPAMYVAEAQRKKLGSAASSADQYLRALGMVMMVRENDRVAAPRISQLTQKTNQFNVTSRRYGEDEIVGFMTAGDSLVLSFSLADVLGDNGIVGVAIVREIRGQAAEIDTLLMSCRVIGRRAEVAFLGEVLSACAERGVHRLAASYVPTAKNSLVREFWTRHGFRDLGGDRYELDLSTAILPREPLIEVRRAAGSIAHRQEVR